MSAPSQPQGNLEKDLYKMMSGVALSLDSGEDLGRCLVELHPVQEKLGKILESAENSHTRFVSFMILDQLRNVRAAYEGREASWYEQHAGNIRYLRVILSEYLLKTETYIANGNYESVLKSTLWFSDYFDKLTTPFSCTSSARLP